MQPEGIAFSVVGLGTAILLRIFPPKSPPMKLILSLLAIGLLIYGISVIIFLGAGAVKIPFWLVMALGAVVGSSAAGMAWKHTRGAISPDTTITAPSKETPKPAEKKESRPVQIEPTKPTSTTPPIVFQLPPVGNLRERAIALSEKIMEDLYVRGWRGHYPPDQIIPPIPTDLKGRLLRLDRSDFFKFSFLEKVMDLRNEFYRLHLKDELLDDLLKSQGIIKKDDGQFSVPPNKLWPLADSPHINTLEVEEFAQRLKILASQIKNN